MARSLLKIIWYWQGDSAGDNRKNKEIETEKEAGKQHKGFDRTGALGLCKGCGKQSRVNTHG